MSTFELAIPTIFKHEGLFCDNENDNGGATNYGISLRWLKSIGDIDADGILDGDINHDSHVDINDVKAMSKADATKLYREYWWDKYQYSNIKVQQVATKIFDLAVNMGAEQAHKMAQRAVWSQYDYKSIEDDGILGNTSILYINNANKDCLLCSLRSEAANFYRLLISKNPALDKYRNGWMNRAYE